MQHDKFMIKIAFSMTINNIQEQTLNHTEMYIFTHGQLCVAFSGSPSYDSLVFASIERRRRRMDNDSLVTSDSVYREVP